MNTKQLELIKEELKKALKEVYNMDFNPPSKKQEMFLELAIKNIKELKFKVLEKKEVTEEKENAPK